MHKKPTVFVRSILDLGDFNDDEVNTEPSMTDPSQDETIQSLVARLMRGEVLGSSVPQFDVEAGAKPADVFATQSHMERDGADIADMGPIMAAGVAAAEALKAVGTPLPPAPEKPVVPPAEASKA